MTLMEIGRCVYIVGSYYAQLYLATFAARVLSDRLGMAVRQLD